MVCGNIKQCYVTSFVSLWNVEFDSTIFLTFAITMRPTSAAKHFSVLSLLEQGYSYCQIYNKTIISLGTISKIGKEVDASIENNSGGRSSKRSTYDKQSIIWQINSGRLDNAVQATNFIDSTLTHPVHPQTVRNALKEAGFHSATKKKVPMLKLTHHQRWLKFARYHENWTGEDWKRVLWSDEIYAKIMTSTEAHCSVPGDPQMSHAMTHMLHFQPVWDLDVWQFYSSRVHHAVAKKQVNCEHSTST